MTIEVGSSGGSSALEFAPEAITAGEAMNNTTSITIAVTPGSYSTLLTATGKFNLNFISVSGVAVENHRIRLTADGVVVWNTGDLAITTGSMILFGGNSTVGFNIGAVVENRLIKTSILLEIQTTADTSVNLNYRLRPVL